MDDGLSSAQQQYIEHFSRRGHHGEACRAAGVSRKTGWRWRTPGQDGHRESFIAAYEEARVCAVEYLRDCAVEQATDADKPNHVVLLRLLEAYDPAFRQKRDVQHSGQVDSVVRRVVLTEASDEDEEDAD